MKILAEVAVPVDIVKGLVIVRSKTQSGKRNIEGGLECHAMAEIPESERVVNTDTAAHITLVIDGIVRILLIIEDTQITHHGRTNQ